jgi:hypothetical protein
MKWMTNGQITDQQADNEGRPGLTQLTTCYLNLIPIGELYQISQEASMVQFLHPLPPPTNALFDPALGVIDVETNLPIG